jgi:hypothetical protein
MNNARFSALNNETKAKETKNNDRDFAKAVPFIVDLTPVNLQKTEEAFTGRVFVSPNTYQLFLSVNGGSD